MEVHETINKKYEKKSEVRYNILRNFTNCLELFGRIGKPSHFYDPFTLS